MGNVADIGTHLYMEEDIGRADQNDQLPSETAHKIQPEQFWL